MIASYETSTPIDTPTATLLAADPGPQLWQRYARTGQGSPEENEIVERNLPLVRTVVGRIAMSLPPHVDIEDLNSAGLVGLLNAIRRFNPRSGASFETYARVRIRGAVLDELRRLDWVPRSVHEKSRRVQDAMNRIEQAKGSAPTDEEVADELDLSLDEYQELLSEIRPATFICLDSVRNSENEDGPRHGEMLADDDETTPDEQTERRELASIIADRIQDLPDAQRRVLALYYFEDLRLREIAEVFGVTESRICQIHAQAILTLKSFLRRHDPEAFACA